MCVYVCENAASEYQPSKLSRLAKEARFPGRRPACFHHKKAPTEWIGSVLSRRSILDYIQTSFHSRKFKVYPCVPRPQRPVKIVKCHARLSPTPAASDRTFGILQKETVKLITGSLQSLENTVKALCSTNATITNTIPNAKALPARQKFATKILRFDIFAFVSAV